MVMKSTRKASPRIVRLLVLAAAAGVFLLAAGFGFAAVQESRDTFCASCHTQPESTFFQRSQASAPSDMASAHTAKNVRCIDCHSGPGVTGRVSAELMGAHNALAWFSGTAVQPAKLTVPVSDQNCLKCHQKVTQQENMQNHFHFFLKRWQSMDKNAKGCVDCHTGHITGGVADTSFLTEQQVAPVCEACHRVAGEGD